MQRAHAILHTRRAHEHAPSVCTCAPQGGLGGRVHTLTIEPKSVNNFEGSNEATFRADHSPGCHTSGVRRPATSYLSVRPRSKLSAIQAGSPKREPQLSMLNQATTADR